MLATLATCATLTTIATCATLDCKTVRIFADFCVFNQVRTSEARALLVRKTLTPHFTDFFTDFEKKTDCFAV